MPTGPATSTKSIGDALKGTVVADRYECREIIGRGGAGVVYLAFDQEENKEVVVKALAPHWCSNPDALARFQREAQRLSRMHHPNIVRMFDHGIDGATPFLVMEYLSGELLSDYMQGEGPLTLKQFVPIAAQVLKGVGHAHSRELMVRDIKPSNVMLSARQGRRNVVKILDFGLARLLGDERITQEHVLGTVGYLSPEQLENKELDLRVDVYALGVMFFAMLSGRLPFVGDSDAAIFHQTVNEEPADLRRVCPNAAGLSLGLVELIHDCIRKDPEQRPADADAVVERLIDAVPCELFRLPRDFASPAARRVTPMDSDIQVVVPPRTVAPSTVAPHTLAPQVAPSATVTGPASSVPVVAQAASSASMAAPGPVLGGPDLDSDLEIAAPRSSRGLVLGGVALIAMGLVGGYLLRPQGAPPPAVAAVAAPQPAQPQQAASNPLSTDELLVLVNQSDASLALDYTRRQEAIVRLRTTEAGNRIDTVLQLKLDLLQAASAADPCAVFSHALDELEERATAVDFDFVRNARAPEACAALGTRTRTLVQRLQAEANSAR